MFFYDPRGKMVVCKKVRWLFIIVGFISYASHLGAMLVPGSVATCPPIKKIFFGLQGVLVDSDVKRAEGLLMTFSRQEWHQLHENIKESVSLHLHAYEARRLSWIMSRISIIIGALLNQNVAMLVRERVALFVAQHLSTYTEHALRLHEDDLYKTLYEDGVIDDELNSVLGQDQEVRAALQIIVNTTGCCYENVQAFIIREVKTHGINILARKRLWLPIHVSMLQYISVLKASGFILARQLKEQGCEIFLVTTMGKAVIDAYARKEIVRDAIELFDPTHIVGLDDLRREPSGESVFIDVNPELLMFACNIGMHTVDFRIPYEQVLEKLRALGVLKPFNIVVIHEQLNFEELRIRYCSGW